MSEMIQIHSKKLRPRRFRPRRKVSYFEAARILGNMMGERLFQAFKKGRLSRVVMVEFFSQDVFAEDFEEFYFKAVNRLESHDPEGPRRGVGVALMSQWYFVDDGKACGPLGEEEVLAAVEEGRLGPLDLIFQEGSEKWLPARDVDEFREIFRAKDQDVDAQPTWVLLRKKPKAQGAGYVQSGPFSSNELREKIEAGEVDYSDFVWKEGMKAWRKLIDSKEFKKIFKKIPAEMLEAQTITNVSIQPELPGEELLKDVMQGKIKKPVMEFAEQGQEMPPLEAEGPDLTKEEVPPVFEGDEAPPAPTSPETEEFLKERTQKEQQLKAGTKGEIPKGPVVAKRATLGDEIKEALPKAVPSLPVGLFMTLVAIIFLATGAWLVYSSLPSKEEKEAAFRQAELNRQQLKKREEERARQEQREQERAAKEAAAAAAQPSEPEPPPEPLNPRNGQGWSQLTFEFLQRIWREDLLRWSLPLMAVTIFRLKSK